MSQQEEAMILKLLTPNPNLNQTRKHCKLGAKAGH